MTPTSRVNVDDLPDSPYARELRRGVGGLGFDPPLESAYLSVHLRRVHLRVRTWFTLVATLSVLFTIDQAHRTVPGTAAFWVRCCTTLPGALLPVWLVWSRYYERLFLPVARVLVPINLATFAVFVALDVNSGHQEEVAALTVNVVAAFFFMGLLYRAALSSAATIVVAYVLGVVAAGLVSMTALRSVLAYVVTGVLSAVIALDVERSQRRSFLEDALIAEMVSRDGLSGLMNRRALDEHLLRVWQQAHRDRRTLAILMIDIDHFKIYNDTYGHQSGDVAIRAVAQRIGGFARRPLDIAARYGGEEFVILLYDLPFTDVADICERLRETVQNLRLGNNGRAHEPNMNAGEGPAATDTTGAGVTVSIGAAVVTPMLGRTPHAALQLADEALYDAKQSGRNRVVLKGAAEYGAVSTGKFKVSANTRQCG